jgi:hypothetical protein
MKAERRPEWARSNRPKKRRKGDKRERTRARRAIREGHEAMA